MQLRCEIAWAAYLGATVLSEMLYTRAALSGGRAYHFCLVQGYVLASQVDALAKAKSDELTNL